MGDDSTKIHEGAKTGSTKGYEGAETGSTENHGSTKIHETGGTGIHEGTNIGRTQNNEGTKTGSTEVHEGASASRQPGAAFERLVAVMRTLRSSEGCPWDREQTLQSLTDFVLEEAYEVIDAIERRDTSALQEEIGDHIFEGVFLAQVAAESGLFTVADSLTTVADKLVRRHPHVFQDDGRVHDAGSKERAPSADAALQRWNSLKAQERSGAGTPHSTLGGVPKGLPSLLRAFKIGKRAAGTGFDWNKTDEVIAKIEEEVAELRDTLSHAPEDHQHAEEEMGDLLFAIANLSRKLDIEPEAALRRANDKFTRRFEQMEHGIVRSGRTLEELTLDQMESEWQRVKMKEKANP